MKYRPPPWMPSARQIHFLRSRWGASQPSTLKSVILVRRARSRWPRACGGPVAHEKQRLAHFTGGGGQRWRDRDRTLSWRCCIRSRLQRGLSPWRKQWTRCLGFWGSEDASARIGAICKAAITELRVAPATSTPGTRPGGGVPARHLVVLVRVGSSEDGGWDQRHADAKAVRRFNGCSDV